jgi:hypothetical protein
LYVEGAMLAAGGIVLAVAPAWVTLTLFDQTDIGEYAWVRLAGIHAVGWAIMYVLVANRIEQIWWFCWAFVLVGGAIAALAALNALFGLTGREPASFWWLMAGTAAVFTALLLVGMARTGLERSPE